jgi:peptide/nickel transport system permease protein
MVSAAVVVASALLAEATLSFLGFGVQPPTPTWGNMLTNAQATATSAPWLAVFPGLCISITVTAVMLLGDGIREVFDPRLRT